MLPCDSGIRCLFGPCSTERLSISQILSEIFFFYYRPSFSTSTNLDIAFKEGSALFCSYISLAKSEDVMIPSNVLSRTMGNLRIIGIVTDKDIFKAIFNNQNFMTEILTDQSFISHKDLLERLG